MRSSDDNGQPSVQQPRRANVDLRLSLDRDGTILPWRSDSSAAADGLPLNEIVSAAQSVGEQPGAFLLGGRDPFGRSDLWDVIAAIARIRPGNLGLCTTGQGLTAALVRRLRSSAVVRAHVPFH